MRSNSRSAALAACLILVLPFCRPPCLSQGVDDSLLNREIELHLTNVTLLHALSRLSVEKRVPIGFEPDPHAKVEYRLNIAVNNAKLKDLLDVIVRQEPDYRWEVRDGVINVFPARGRDRFIGELLNTPVQRFAPPKGLGKFRLIGAVIDLPEVQSLMKARGVAALRHGYVYRPSIYENKGVDLGISNTDVRGVLNHIVRESEHKMWRIGRSGRNGEYLEVGI